MGSWVPPTGPARPIRPTRSSRRSSRSMSSSPRPAERHSCRASPRWRPSISEALEVGGKLIVFGNGGSAADAQHFAAELLGRFHRERRALPGIALTTDASTVTAIANDYAFEEVFARQVEGLCRRGDVVVGISTSGDAPNVVHGISAARSLGARTWGLTGRRGGRLGGGRGALPPGALRLHRAHPGDARHDHPRRGGAGGHGSRGRRSTRPRARRTWPPLRAEAQGLRCRHALAEARLLAGAHHVLHHLGRVRVSRWASPRPCDRDA